MGNSISETEAAPEQQHQVKVLAEPKIQISVVQDVECRQNEATGPFITNVPETAGCSSKNQLQIGGNVLNKPKRQLPPLKKNRSSKKFQLQPVSSKENIGTASVIKELVEDKLLEHQTTKSRQKSNVFEVCELKQIETDIESNYIETRARKMRVSKLASNTAIS